VRGAAGTRRHGDVDERQRDQDERDVHREDQPPRRRVDEVAAGERPDDGGDPGPRRPRADGGGPLLPPRERRDDHRQPARRQQRAERTLERPTRDQDLDARRDRAQQRHDPEAANADREHGPFPIDVAERSADQDQRGEREQVGVRYPLLARQAAAEIAADRRQGDVHRRRIEPHDERAHDRRDESESLAATRSELAVHCRSCGLVGTRRPQLSRRANGAVRC
jgi:hypothetical protein